MPAYKESILSGVSGNLSIPEYFTEFTELIQAVNNLKDAVLTLNTSLNNSIGTPSISQAGSLGNSAGKTAGYLKAIGTLGTDDTKKQGDGLAALCNISRQLSGIASSINTGVAIQTLTSMDQMQKNAFDKEATQQALDRNKIPKVVVTEANFSAQVESNIRAGSNLYAQASTVALVNATATRAITGAANYAYDLLPSFSDISNNFKKLFESKAADPEGQGKITLATQILGNPTA